MTTSPKEFNITMRSSNKTRNISSSTVHTTGAACTTGKVRDDSTSPNNNRNSPTLYQRIHAACVGVQQVPTKSIGGYITTTASIEVAVTPQVREITGASSASCRSEKCTR